MLRAIKCYKTIVSGGLFGGTLILAQLVACGPTVDSGSGSTNSGGAGSTAASGGSTGTGGANNSACACLAAYGGPSLGDDALMTLRDEGLPTCFHENDPALLNMERICLPSVVGQQAINGRDIEVYYFCSDVCPDAGHIGIRFSGIKDTPSCCAINGIPLLDAAWGGFEACVPSAIDPMVPWVDKCP